MIIKPVVSLNPGDVITLAETEFVVLDIIDGCPFVVALLNQGSSKFGDNNDYSKSFLRNAMNNWLEDFDIDSDLVMEREIDLTTLDGYKGYGKLKVKAAPLTMDEARRYAELIPNPDSWSWLATGWGGTEEPRFDARSARALRWRLELLRLLRLVRHPSGFDAFLCSLDLCRD